MPTLGAGNDEELLRREPEAEPAHTLVLLDVLFCDNERDPEILDRYFARFEHALASVRAQDVPEGVELLVTIQMSSDKRRWIDRTVELLRSPPASSRTRIGLYEYEHPPEGYEGGDPERVDWVKKPNLHSPLREKMFIDTHRELRVDRYRRVIRVGLDDDDVWMPWHTATLCEVANAARLDPNVTHDGVLALGILDTLVAYIEEDGVVVDSVRLKRSLSGEKFHVIDAPDSVRGIAEFSPSAVPERVDAEFHDRFARRGVGLYGATGFLPGFVYMRWGQNLSRQGKEYLETKRFGQLTAESPGEVSLIPREDIPCDDQPTWIGVPGAEVPLAVTAVRKGTRVEVTSNIAFQAGKDLKVSYYLMRGTQKIDSTWYSATPEAVFENAPPGVFVRAFVRPSSGAITRADSAQV